MHSHNGHKEKIHRLQVNHNSHLLLPIPLTPPAFIACPCRKSLYDDVVHSLYEVRQTAAESIGRMKDRLSAGEYCEHLE